MCGGAGERPHRTASREQRGRGEPGGIAKRRSENEEHGPDRAGVRILRQDAAGRSHHTREGQGAEDGTEDAQAEARLPER